MKLHQLFFYLTLVLLPTQLGYHSWPAWALVLGRKIDYLSPTLFLTDITIVLTLVSFVYDERRLLLKKLLSKASLLWMTSIFLFAFINIVFAVSPMVAFSKWLKAFEYLFFGVYIVWLKPSVKRLSLLFLIPVLYSSLLAVTQFFLQHSVGGIFWYLGERTFTIHTPGIARFAFPFPVFGMQSAELLRPYGTFPHPNVLAGFLAVILPFVIWHYPMRVIGFRTHIFRILFFVAVSVGYAALFLTFSRSAWIAGLIGTVIVILMKKNIIPAVRFLSILALCLCALLALPYFRQLTSESESVSVRQDLVSSALAMFRSSPIVGVGLGNFIVELPEFSVTRQIFFLQPVHNIYLLFFTETGLLGIVALCFLLFMTLRNILHKDYFVITSSPRYSVSSSPRPFVAFLPLLFFLALGAVDHYPVTLQQGQILATLLVSLFIVYR